MEDETAKEVKKLPTTDEAKEMERKSRTRKMVTMTIILTSTKTIPITGSLIPMIVLTQVELDANQEQSLNFTKYRIKKEIVSRS